MTTLPYPTKETSGQMRELGDAHARRDHETGNYVGIDDIYAHATAVARDELGVQIRSGSHDPNLLAYFNGYEKAKRELTGR